MYYDTHFHLNEKVFNDKNHDQIIRKSKENGVLGIINVSATCGEAKKVVELSKKYDFMHSAIGVHPSEVNKINKKVIEELEQIIIDNPKKVVAIGECGLDYYYEQNPSREIQKKWFIEQIKLAKKYNLTLIVHSRSASKDTIEILKNYKSLRIIIHCYTYDEEIVNDFLEIGCYISFSGIITFKAKVESIQNAIAKVPLNKLLCETDGPLLSPEPFRGKINYPENVKYVYKKIEELLKKPILKQIEKNYMKVFNLKNG